MSDKKTENDVLKETEEKSEEIKMVESEEPVKEEAKKKSKKANGTARVW